MAETRWHSATSVWPRSVSDFLLKSAAIFGALTTLASGWVFFLAPVEIDSRAPELQPPFDAVNVLANTTTDIRVPMSNLGRNGDCDLEMRRVFVDTGSSTGAQAQQTVYHIPSAETKDVIVSVRLLQPGPHLLHIEGVARSGRLRRSGSVAVTIPLHVWVPLVLEKELKAKTPANAATDICVLRAKLHSGVAHTNGLTCEAWPTGPGALVLAAVSTPTDAPGIQDFQRIPAPVAGIGSAKLIFRTKAVPQFTSVPFLFVVEGSGAATPQDCTRLEKRIEWKCVPSLKEAEHD